MKENHWLKPCIIKNYTVTLAQAVELLKLNCNLISMDNVIDWLREKHNIIIYNSIEPFVDPTEDNHHILYRFALHRYLRV